MILRYTKLKRIVISKSLPARTIAKLIGLSAALIAIVFLQSAIRAQTAFSESPDGKALIIEDAPEMQVIAFARTVVIKKHAKEAFVWGGDIIVEGRVDGDVAAIGGSVIQKEGAYIGGAVLVFGGSYRPESREPLRAEGKETIMFGVFEEELREMAQNPSQIFSPAFTPAFIAQRALSVLFWFVVTLLVSTIAPGAVSRAIARVQLSTLKVIGMGFSGFLLTTIGVVVSLGVLPDYMSALIGLMAFALLMLAYGFGRVALQVSTGKLIQKHLLPSSNKSEALAILIGVVVWSILLSIPYVWTLALLILFAVGIGLVITARSSSKWKTV